MEIENKKAVDYFLNKEERWNCCEAIFKRFQDITDLSDEEIRNLYSSKGGGKAEAGLCGAAYAAELISTAKDNKSIVEEFKQKAGDSTCKEIRSKKVTSCKACVAIAEEIVENILSQKQEIEYSHK